MTTKKDITSVELMDNMPTGTHKVIIDTYEEEKYDEYTYLNFQLVGLGGEVSDKQIKYGVPFPKSGKTTGKSKLGKLIKAAFPTAEGKIDFENDLLQKEVMIRVVEDGSYFEVDAVWAIGQEPPVPSTESNDELKNNFSTEVEVGEVHNSSRKNPTVPTV
jgi:hypothetical protein|tara:strand:+ start:832 stop:1311 length:480 start_codon:yes stop_codon:yes gene_type:complete